MSISHHPTEATLIAHGAGNLDEASRVVIASHLAVCPQCRHDTGLAETLGGQLLECLPGEALAPDALARTLSRLNEPVEPLPSLPPGFDLGVALPRALRRYRLSNWRWIAPGIRFVPVLARAETIGLDGQIRRQSALHLFNIAPGVAMPDHGHGGSEFACILAGSYDDRIGHFGPGDLAEMAAEDGEDFDHMPVADRQQGCICLIASEAKLRFRGSIARLLQPLLGF